MPPREQEMAQGKGFRITAPPLGRNPVKTTQTLYQRRKKKQEAAERNHIEGKFGQGKNGYNLNQIRAKLKDTSECWIACIFFVMNLIHYENNHFFGSILNWLDRILMDPSALTEIKCNLWNPGYVKINGRCRLFQQAFINAQLTGSHKV